MKEHGGLVLHGNGMQPGLLTHIGGVVQALHLRMRLAQLLLQLVNGNFR